MGRVWRLKPMTLLNECSSVRRHACGIAQENSLRLLLALAARFSGTRREGLLPRGLKLDRVSQLQQNLTNIARTLGLCNHRRVCTDSSPPSASSAGTAARRSLSLPWPWPEPRAALFQLSRICRNGSAPFL